MKTLLILSKDEKINIPKEILIRNVQMEDNLKVLSNIMDFDYDMIIFTDNALQGVTRYDKVSFIRSIIVFTNIKLVYIKQTSEETDIQKEMLSYGNGNIYNFDIMNMSINKFMEIEDRNIRVDKVERKSSINNEDINNLNLILSDIEMVSKYDIDAVLSKNKNDIISLLYGYKSSLEEINNIKLENVKLNGEMSVSNDSIKRLTKEIGETKNKNLDLKSQLKQLRVSVLSYQDKIDEYNKIKVLDENINDYKVDLNTQYGTTILYFKQLEEIEFLNIFDAIYHDLSKVNKRYVKAMILEEQGRIFCNPYEKYDYTIVGQNPTIETLINEDKIVRYGNAYKILELMNKPQMRLEVLMILDKTNSSNIHIASDKLVPMYLGKHRDNIKTLNIDDTSFISPYEGRWSGIRKLLELDPYRENIMPIYRMAVASHELVENIYKFLGVRGDLVV